MLCCKIELVGPLIKCGMHRISDNHIDAPLMNLLLNLLKKFLNCHCNHGNQKKVTYMLRVQIISGVGFLVNISNFLSTGP